MWVEAVGGVGSLALLGVIVKIGWARVGRKQDTTMCDQRYTEIKEDLTKGDEKFTAIDKKLDELNKEQGEQGKVLVKVYTIVDRMEKNGR